MAKRKHLPNYKQPVIAKIAAAIINFEMEHGVRAKEVRVSHIMHKRFFLEAKQRTERLGQKHNYTYNEYEEYTFSGIPMIMDRRLQKGILVF